MYASLPPLYNVCCLFASAWLHVTHLIMINSVSKDREDGSTLLLTVGHHSKIRHCRRVFSVLPPRDTGTHSAKHALYSTWQLSDTGTHSAELALYSTWQLSDTGTHSAEHALYRTWEGEEGCLGGARVKICINSSSFRNQRDSVEVGFFFLLFCGSEANLSFKMKGPIRNKEMYKMQTQCTKIELQTY